MISSDESLEKQPRQLGRDLFLVLGITAVLAIMLVLVLPFKYETFGHAFGVFLTSVIYGLSIGGTITLVFSRLGARLKRIPFPLDWIISLATVLFFTAIGCLLAGFILVEIGYFRPENYWATFRRDIRYTWAISLVIGIVMSLIDQLRDKLAATRLQLHEKELAAERARKLAIEARLSSLESRIHPHFLFNTLNSISSLIQEDPQQAERLVERLAALLRFSLDSNQQSTVPLRQELKITRDYLEIERTRIGDRLRYAIEVPAELEAIDVPPLAVQTIVENSVKYAIAPRRGGGAVRITAYAAQGRVQIAVADDGPGFAPDALQAGHGLDNLQARLAALFDNAAALDIARRDEQTIVTISLPHVQSEAVNTV
jgi:signal transduction histidine kinase